MGASLTVCLLTKLLPLHHASRPSRLVGLQQERTRLETFRCLMQFRAGSGRIGAMKISVAALCPHWRRLQLRSSPDHSGTVREICAATDDNGQACSRCTTFCVASSLLCSFLLLFFLRHPRPSYRPFVPAVLPVKGRDERLRRPWRVRAAERPFTSSRD